jgi:exoribonuclease R
MNQPTTSSRNRLRSIARRAMTARGLLPDFSPVVLAETAAITEVPAGPASSVRDLRGLLWVSIDNDDSRDLVTQRLLKAALAGRPVPYANDDLDTLDRHCTEQEDNAAKVERQVRKSAAALLLASRIGERFAAIVTGASEKGTWVRIFQPIVEGKVIRGFEGLDVGDRVRVELVHTDVERGFIDFVRSREGAT